MTYLNIESNTIYVYPYNEVYVQVVAEDSILAEFSAYFTFEAKNARFHPKFKAKLWDGKIRVFNRINNTIYKGLIDYIERFCEERQYQFVLDPALTNQTNFTEQDFQKLLNEVKPVYVPFDYQQKAVIHSINSQRTVLLSPTSSGKSFTIYLLSRYYLKKQLSVLIVVPSTNLVEQMATDFEEYTPQYNINEKIHKIYGDAEKHSNKPICISTWQSLLRQPKKFFDLYDVIFVDEAHNYKGSEIRKVLERASNIKYRIGTTGTLDDVDLHRYTIEGLLGKAFEVTETNHLMDRGIVSKLKINCIQLEYSSEDRETVYKLNYKDKNKRYQNEINFVLKHQKRNSFVTSLVKQLLDKQENVLVLCDRIEHCDLFYDKLKNLGCKVYKITGEVETKTRETIRRLVENENGVVIIATYGTMSTGVNIKNLQHIVFAFAGKSLIRILQSIGRVLRLDGKLNKSVLWDIIDDFGHITKKGTKTNNILLKHGIDRLKIYIKSKFVYNLTKIKL